MAYQTLGYEQAEHVVTLTCNRPEQHNAVNRLMNRELHDAWGRFRDDDDAFVLVITGARETTFCAGWDLQDAAELSHRYRIDSILARHGFTDWHVIATGVSGALVECGVWRGGSAMVMAHVLVAAGVSDRELWLYDTFEGMPAPEDVDADFMGVPAAEHLAAAAGNRDDLVVAYASLDEVRANVQKVGYPIDLVRYVVGQVEHTIPAQAPGEIALLRLGTDWESSTRHELEHLWPRLEVGGVLIIDDYGHWSGARRAVDGYFAGRGDAPLLARVNYTGRMGVRVHQSAEA
ncbi:MAG TPA: TylF/MycF/NovP-related O-methyltransferase [Solirubrobacteraceae bacterium]|nr:TylF/MycF/NovP-related O-methyltransferase [Solirubrobacteraceae bacterium]